MNRAIRRISYIALTGVFALSFPVSAAAVDANGGLTQAVDRDVAVAKLQGSHLGILVTALPSGDVLYAHNANDAFTPASTLKLLTGLTALEVLGNSATFNTTLALRGSMHGSRFDGDIVLQTDGDPLLTQSDLAAATDEVARLGITEIDGNAVVESRLNPISTYPGGWLIDDLPFDYAPPVAGIAIDENTVHVTVTAAQAAGAQATVTLSVQDARIFKQLGITVRSAVMTGV